MDFQSFVSDFRKYLRGRSFELELCKANGLVYLRINQIYADELNFCENYGLFLLSVCRDIRGDFYLEVCLAPRR